MRSSDILVSILTTLWSSVEAAGNMGLIHRVPCTHPLCDHLPDPVLDESLNDLEQEDPRLIAFIRDQLIGEFATEPFALPRTCLLYTSPSPRD